MAAPATASPSVYVGDLDAKVTEAMLYDHFRAAGQVMSVRVCLDSQTQKSLGYGYVNFQNPADADKAIDDLNGSKLSDRPIRVTRIQRDPAQRKAGTTNVVIKGLSKDTDWAAVKELFSKFGKIFSMKVPTDEGGASRGYAYVMFDREEAAAQAVTEMNGTELNDVEITVERYKNPAASREEAAKNFTNLYVKNLKRDVTDESFSKVFSQFGTITSSKVRFNDTNGDVVGFGFVAFDQHEAAVAALEATNEKPHAELAAEGQVLLVKRFENKKERLRHREQLWRERKAQFDKYPNLYVKNFEDDVTQERLKEVFERFGETMSVAIQRDPVTKQSRGFGFVSFKNHESAEKAITALAGSHELGERPLFVSYAQRRDQRRAQFEELTKKRQQRGMGMGAPFGGMMMQSGAVLGGPQMMPFGMQPGGPQQLYAPRTMPGGQFGGPLPGQGGLRPGGMPGQPGLMPGQPGPGVNPMNPMGAAQMQLQQQAMMQRAQQLAAPRPQPKPAMPAHPSGLDAQYLASIPPEQQKNILGERLYAFIVKKNPGAASKITGMLLEMDNSEILNLLDSPMLLDNKVNEAIEVLQRHGVQ